MASSAPPRRFKVEPIETTITSSKDKHQADHVERPKPRRFLPQPIETTTSSSKASRKFAPQPIETTKKTNRRFAPEPIETTKKSNRRFAPEPIETTTRSSRQKFAKDWEEQTSPTGKFKANPMETASPCNGQLKGFIRQTPKRFRPQLIEIAQRSRKAGDDTPTLLPQDKTEATPDSAISARKARILGISPSPPTPPTNTPTFDMSQNPLFLEIQRNCSPLSRRRSYFSSSQHSFRVPDLDPIESSESEASAPSSPSTESPPPYSSDHSFMYKEATRRRESVDDRSAGYLLKLAAKAAEKQLREQALAAFPNSEFHEPVAHYVDRDTEESEPSLTEAKPQEESSFTEVNWDLETMRKFQEAQMAEKEKQDQTENAKPAFSPFGNPAGFLDAATAKKFAKERRDPELERQRREARPPMLGQEIRFPRCQSPEPSRFDPTQGCDAVRTAMCYLSEQSKAASEKDEKLAVEQTIEEEFGDDFVTQVYNYLSLGYPSMARPFDEELSKVSNISISELRQDDHLATSRGYIRLGKDGNLKDTEITEETCMRWRALRIYIQEWARQHPNMAEDEFLGAGRGTAVRKGSWAL
ncbi:hypothetical protein PtrM4_140600 [Pyrenophora tritici-repentis]|uniref:Uncharacterized protein n=1 Tax=Pyrenophora tritici-repentis TaxID=45151 RepID=A0A834RPR7_9PLEO|nr:hypothetical protein PtrM4_140600 [Pyrenophora tritici-repentis]